jgi:nucleoside-diphosphate-sugar epimerase
LNVLITGITGFIGSRLAARLVERGDDVYGLVRHSSERELKRIESIVPRIHLIEGDLVRFHSVLSAVETSDPNIVFHLGALTPVRLSFDDPYPYIGINFDGTVNLVHSIVRQSPNTRLIAASTAEVYGWQPDNRPIPENAILNPASPYAVSKAAADQYVQMANRIYHLRGTVMRPINSYGRVWESGFYTEYLISKMLKGETCYIGAPESIRDYMYCVAERTLIHTEQGPKFVEELTLQDRVLTIDGTYRQILGVRKLPVGMKNTFELKPFYLPPVVVTGDHLVYTFVRQKFGRNNARNEGFACWLEAQDLYRRISNGSSTFPTGDTTFHMFLPLDSTRRGVPGINSDRCEILGWYLAEGWVGRDGRLTEFSLGSDERKSVERLLELVRREFSAEGSVREIPEKHALELTFWSKELGSFILSHTTGNGDSRVKAMSPTLLRLPEDEEKALIDAAWLGDGGIWRKTNGQLHKAYATSSMLLASQLQTLLFRQNVRAGFAHSTNSSGKDIYALNVYPEAAPKSVLIQDKFNEAVWSRLAYVRPVIYSDAVYDISVEVNRNFVTSAGLVHNCEDHVDAYLDVAKSEKAIGGVYNVSPGNPVTNAELAKKLSGLTGFKGKLVFGSYPPGYPQRPQSQDPAYLVLDNARISKEVGWRPHYSLDEGLKQTIDLWNRKTN